MNQRRATIHQNIYLFGIIILAVGLPLSKVLMSIGQFLLALNWLAEGNITAKFRMFLKNKPALLISSLLLLHLVGLIWSTDLNEGLKDIRIKSPLFLLPLLFSTTPPLTSKQIRNVLILFILAVVTSSAYSTWLLIINDYVNTREASKFISHVRFSLLICLAIFILIKFITEKDHFNKLTRIAFSLIFAWLIFFQFYAEWFTGITVSIVTAFILIIIEAILTKSLIRKIAFSLLIVAIPILLFIYIKNISAEYLTPLETNVETFDKQTINGNTYTHDIENSPIENGSCIGIYVSQQELAQEWNKRSSIDYYGEDRCNQNVSATLIRYLNSKGLRKDSAGLSKLSDEDIRAVERGIANFHYLKKYSIKKRIYEVLWEYQIYNLTKNPSGHSVTQRFEYWQTAMNIIKTNPVIGVGTGDVQNAFNEQYEKNNSKLDKKWRLRTHNQFLAIAVAFGIIGFIWFLTALFYPPIKTGAFKNYYFYIFFIIALLSMLTEDTLETQAGATFIAFFLSFYLFVKHEELQSEFEEK